MRGDELTGLAIERWAHGGDGVGRPTEGPLAGAVVFVPGTVPGDTVTVRLEERRKRWARASVVTLERPSPHRVVPPCRSQPRCGGCPWMVGSTEVQARARLEILRFEARKRLGWSLAEAERRVELARLDGRTEGYRVRVRLAYAVRAGGRVTLGYRPPRSHQIVDEPSCPVAHPTIRAALGDVRAALATRGSGQGEVTLLAGREGVAGHVVPSRGLTWRLGPERVTVGATGHEVSAQASSFVQANPEVAAAIAGEIEATARELAGGRAVELFCGSGTLSGALLAAGYELDAYEVDPAAEGGFAAAWSEHPGARWHACDLLAAGVPDPAPAAPPDIVLLDPPRAGAAPVMPWIASSGARVVCLVSCDVATGLRDLRSLQDAGYRVARVTGYDMFPHTGHQELLAVARR